MDYFVIGIFLALITGLAVVLKDSLQHGKEHKKSH